MRGSRFDQRCEANISEGMQPNSIEKKMVLTKMNLQDILLELGPEIEKQGLICDAENKFAEENFRKASIQ